MCNSRGWFKAPAPIHRPLGGSYTSVLARSWLALCPPVTTTLPSCNKVAVCSSRPVARGPELVQVFVAGSKSSEVAASANGLPPAISTVPFGKSVAVWSRRNWCSGCTNVNEPAVVAWQASTLSTKAPSAHPSLLPRTPPQLLRMHVDDGGPFILV